MVSLKQDIPNLATLEKRLSEVFDNDIEDFVKSTKERRQVVITNRRYFTTTAITLVCTLVFLFLFANTLSSTPKIVFVISTIVLSIVVIIFSYRWYREQNLFAQELNTLLLPTISECLSQPVTYSKDVVHQKETEELLRESELISNYDAVRADDMYTFGSPYPLSVREIFVTRTQSNGKHTTTVTVFHGVLVEVQLPKTLSGITFISTEGDKGGFGHQSFWTGINDTHKVEETLLEWNEFERDLHVASNDGTEARYILTPNFMLDLHTWWSEHKQNIRMVFKGNKLFMLLPDTGTKIASSTTSVEKTELKDYVMSILRPLWRTITLVEDIRL